MPKQLGSALTFMVFLVAIAVAANRAEENSTEPARRTRGPASLEPHAEAAEFRHTAKLHGPVETKIDLVGEAPTAAGDVFTLRGEISSAQALDRIAYRWSLPADVELVNGNPNGEIAHLDANQTQSVELTLKAKSSANAQVHLLASAKAHGARFAESAQFNTTAQTAFAESRARLSKATREAEATVAAKQQLKVIH